MTRSEALDTLIALADEARALSVAQDARALAQRLSEGRFFVACLGQFKRGKSTVMNALLGEALLPTGVAPVTSVVTVVRFGSRRARLRLGADPWRDISLAELKGFVTEAENPENSKHVTAVEVFSPSPLLERGLCLVDTPGVGSVFQGNTDETKAFVPHLDAALVVLGGDPPISGEELELVAAASGQVKELLVVLNKADRLSEEERAEARRFTEGVLERRLPELPCRFFDVSALQQLQGGGPLRDWPALLHRLKELSRTGARELLDRAAERGLRALTRRLQTRLTEERDALVRPVEDSKRRLEQLRRTTEEAERTSAGLRHLFDAEQERLHSRFEADAGRFVERAVPRVDAAVGAALAEVPLRRGPEPRRQTMGLVQKVGETLVRQWLTELQPAAERDFTQATERLVAHANAFLGQLRTSEPSLSSALPPGLRFEPGFRERSHFVFAPLNRYADPSSLGGWLVERVAGCAYLRRRAQQLAAEFARLLVETNASRAVGDFDMRMIESRRSIESALRRTLQEAVALAEEAGARAAEARARGQDAVSAALRRVDGQLERLAKVLHEASHAVESGMPESGSPPRDDPPRGESRGGA